MKRFLKGLIGANRPRVIAVIGTTRHEVETGVAHALTAETRLPVWAWCAENAEPVAGCAHFVSGAGAGQIGRGLRSVWPALSIVAWTGERGYDWLKLLPLFCPPFRVVAFNEANGFFGVRTWPLWAHAFRRFRDVVLSGVRRMADWIAGAFALVRAIGIAIGKRVAGTFALMGAIGIEIGKRVRERVTGLVGLVWATCLAVLAFAAQGTSGWARRTVARFAEGECAGREFRRATGTAFVEVEIPHRGWPRRAIAKAVADSDADFIVLRHRAETAPAEPLPALARDTNSFAAARQIAWAGWRETVAQKHPFRALQAGEVTEVAAPYSSLIAIRRDLLAQFGVPHALTFGAALLILFRKAAAEGLASVVLGYEGGVTQEPAMALEDAEFAARVALSGPLRALAPVDAGRARGNLAWSQLHRRHFRAKPRVLVVSPYLPFPLSHGGAVRIYNLCRALSQEIDFVLACFREADETVHYDELHEVFREVYVVDSNEKHADATVPSQVAEYRNAAMAGLIRRMCSAGEVDLVQLEYTQMAEYGAEAQGVPVILVEHDLTFTLHQQLAQASANVGTRRQYELWLAFEREALRSANAVWTMSLRDRAVALEQGASAHGTTMVPNGVDLQRFRPQTRRTPGHTVLFVGSFRHLPNLMAFEALREQIMPLVWASHPEAILHAIAGPNHLRAAQLAGKSRLLDLDARIRVDGFVEDVRPAYRECDVVVVPLPVSAGTNIKVMEAMASGRPIVSTPLGCQGLDLRDPSDLLIRGIGPEFADAISMLLWDEPLRGRMGERARQTAERRFDWNEISRAALASYSGLLRTAAPEAVELQRISI